ncbi:MAG: SurA N-terminal domain-containing protein [Elusimicrobia bacterium]|nr:SurA N-terminal domain-containing protein [Elusimicrobiota bacterium]
MISFFSKHKRIFFIIISVVFLGSIFFISGQIFSSSASAAVADVGGKKIPYQQFRMQVNRILANFRESGTETNDAMMKSVKQEVFRDMVVEELFSSQAEKMGMRVPDFEVAVEIQNTPQFREGSGFSPRRYYQTIYNEFQMSPAEYEAWRKKARLASKFKQFIYTTVKVTPDEAKAYYLTKNKGLKDFEKDKAKYAEELSKDKFANLANYMLRQLTSQIEIKSYMELREQGR